MGTVWAARADEYVADIQVYVAWGTEWYRAPTPSDGARPRAGACARAPRNGALPRGVGAHTSGTQGLCVDYLVVPCLAMKFHVGKLSL